MMKLRVLIIALLLALVIPPLAVLGSEVSGAQYYGIITVSNNSTAAENVSTTCTINTQALIDGGYLNSTANNTVLRNSSGDDVPFMPGYDGNPWIMWVPSIGADSYLTYILYTASSSDGEIRYFPGTGGMTTSDNASLELGNNFEIEQAGYIDTSSGSDKNLVYKQGAFKTYVSATDNVTSVLLDAWTSPTGFNDPDITWTDETLAYDSNNTTYAYYSTNPSGWGSYIEFTIDASYIDRVRYDTVEWAVPGVATIDIDLYYNDVWNDLYQGNDFHHYWTTKEIGSAELVSEARVRFDAYAGYQRQIYEFEFGKVTGDEIVSITATEVSSGEHIIKTTADGTNLKIYVDGVERDSAACGAGVLDNSNDWTFLQNDVMPYMDYHKITVGGTLKQHIVYEYDTTFNDQTAYNNDATPTFRTTSSDADVSAELTSFLPIAEAKAPAYVLGETSPFISSTANITGTFTTTPPTGTFPLAGVIKAVADATGTPAQLPLLVIACFVILAASLTVSAIMRRYGSGSVFVKILVIAAFMGIFIALANFGIDFWMLVVFLIIACALAMASKQLGWT